MSDIVATPISPEAFAPYGRHMHVGQATEGMTTRAIRDGTVGLTQSAHPLGNDPAARWSLDFYATPLTAPPLAITQAERHRHSAQVFIPMGTTRWLVVVWPGTGNPAPMGPPRAFLAGPQDAVSYDADIWHHGIVALAGSGKFASLMGRMPGGGDTEFADLEAPVAVRWQP